MYSSLLSSLQTPQPLHISLSAPLSLETDQRASFLAAATVRVSDLYYSLQLPSSGFSVQPRDCHWVSNLEQTRWFLALRIQRPGNDVLNKLLAEMNAVAKGMRQQTLYAKTEDVKLSANDDCKISRREDKGKRGVSSGAGHASSAASERNAGLFDFSDHFHLSLAWTTERPPPLPSETKDEHCSNEGGTKPQEYERALARVKTLQVSFSELKVKIGNNITPLPLATGQIYRDGGILG